ncbi:MAG: hypothetical protein ABFS46_04525 [Myxococcota bacterium]
MRGLKDISMLAAAAALVFGIGAFGTMGCSAQDSSVDSAPPMEGELVEIDELEVTEEVTEEEPQE